MLAFLSLQKWGQVGLRGSHGRGGPCLAEKSQTQWPAWLMSSPREA